MFTYDKTEKNKCMNVRLFKFKIKTVVITAAMSLIMTLIDILLESMIKAVVKKN